MLLTQGTSISAIVLPNRYIESLKIDLRAKSCLVYSVTPSNNSIFFFGIKKETTVVIFFYCSVLIMTSTTLN